MTGRFPGRFFYERGAPDPDSADQDGGSAAVLPRCYFAARVWPKTKRVAAGLAQSTMPVELPSIETALHIPLNAGALIDAIRKVRPSGDGVNAPSRIDRKSTRLN